MKTSSLIAALALAGTVGVAASVPASYAQTTARPIAGTSDVQVADRDGWGPRWHNRGGMRGDDMRGNGMRGPMRGAMMGHAGPGGLIGLLCSNNGAQHLETMLDRLSARLSLTDDQKPLFDAFKTAALTAETGYADACTPAGKTARSSDLLAMLEQHQDNLKAYVAAMDSVMPSLEAFYNSLSDDQKADLMPHRGGRFGDDRQRWRKNPGQAPMGRQGNPAAPAPAPNAAPAPGTGDSSGG